MAKAKRKAREPRWIIEFTSIDPSLDATVSYENRREAVDVAADFVRDEAKSELEGIGWEPEDEAPKMLGDILALLEKGEKEKAIRVWLDYQREYDPREKIAIGPSGFVSDSPWDFPE